MQVFVLEVGMRFFFIGAYALRFKNIYRYWQRNDNLAKMVAIT